MVNDIASTAQRLPHVGSGSIAEKSKDSKTSASNDLLRKKDGEKLHTTNSLMVASNIEKSSSPRSRRRLLALEQANSVLQAVGGLNRLEGFNLLGVVANPRVGAPGSSSVMSYSPSVSAHGRYNTTSSTTSATSVDDTSTIMGITSSYFQSFEQTINQVSESIGVFNHVLEDWSRSILEDNPSTLSALSSNSLGIGSSTSSLMNPLYAMIGASTGYDDEDAIPESQQRELPPELENVTLDSVHSYLQQCGSEAASFHQLLQENSGRLAIHSRRTSDITINSKSETESGVRRRIDSAVSTSSELMDVSDIPHIFFDENFDLTDSDTFCNLLLSDKGMNILKDNNTDSVNTAGNFNSPISELMPVIHIDSLNGYYDKVELALLEQVRANSGQFFIESQRFAGLHEEIHTLLEAVQNQKFVNTVLQNEMIKPAEMIPICDSQREQLRQLFDVLDRADSLLQCKAGLVGILSAQDDLTAIEQIKYGRKLLRPSKTNTATDNEKEERSTNDDDEIELAKLVALKTISEQLDQYEELVINNLRDELVEIFLSWNYNTPTTSSAYSGTGVTVSTVNGVTSNPPILTENVRNRVKEINAALQSCNALSKAREAYQTRIHDLIRMTVRTTVGEFASDSGLSSTTISAGATAMSLTRFLDCLDMLFEQLLGLLTSAVGVDSFYVSEGLSLTDNVLQSNDSILIKASVTSDTERKEGGDEPSSTEIPIQCTPLNSVVISAAELSSKSISELLRLRKEAHSLVSLEEMKTIWDTCIDFAEQVEKLCVIGGISEHPNSASSQSTTSFAYTSLLRTTLLTQAKAFVERKHESHMSALVAALDSERWVQCDVSFERQAALSRLCSGRSILVSTSSGIKSNGFGETKPDSAVVSQQKSPEIEAEGVRYKVVWSCLLLLEMILTNIATSAQFPSMATNNVSKTSELLRLFNSRTTHLVLGAGAIHSNARLKSINAKHLSLVTQCLGLIMAILPHVRAALSTQMPKKQQSLLTCIDQIKKEYAEHNEKILNKFVSIIGGIVEHSLSKQINGTDFDVRAKAAKTTIETESTTMVQCCVFLDGVSSNTRKMHQVLIALLPPEHLKDVFYRILAYIDSKIPALFIAAAAEAFENQQLNMTKTPGKENNNGKSPQRTTQQQQKQPAFSFPTTVEGKRHFLLEIESTTKTLNGLEGIHPWDFTARNVLERRIEYFLDVNIEQLPSNTNDSTNLHLSPVPATESGQSTFDCGESDQAVDIKPEYLETNTNDVKLSANDSQDDLVTEKSGDDTKSENSKLEEVLEEILVDSKDDPPSNSNVLEPISIVGNSINPSSTTMFDSSDSNEAKVINESC